MGFPPQGYTPISVTRASYIDSIPDIESETDKIPNVELEISQAPETENPVVPIAVTDETSLGSMDITVDVPSGATITSVIALARINIMNNFAQAQTIDLRFDVEGVPLFDLEDIVGFGAVVGASASYVIAEDASDEVTADGQVVTLEAFATLSVAQEVRFQAQYYLFINYKMG